MTGQNRKERKIEFQFDAETVGFYQSIGIQEVGRSLPYQPWDKPIERLFKTVCDKFSRWFESYVGTLTGSKTYAKRQKDVERMLERGELLTMEEFFAAWTDWKNNKYHTREHRGLKDAGEKWVTPIEMYENGPRYMKAAPPREYAAMLLMKADTARVGNQGITKFGTLYTDYELCHYIGQTVGIKWDIDDVTKLYVFDQEGRRICEAVSAELLQFGPHCSQAALERHLRDQKRQEREMREILDSMTRPYEARVMEEGRPSDAVGKIDLTVKAARDPKIVSLPNDKEFRAEMAAGRQPKKKAGAGDEFLNSKANDALSRLRAMNE
jgi:putative transposase